MTTVSRSEGGHGAKHLRVRGIRVAYPSLPSPSFFTQKQAKATLTAMEETFVVSHWTTINTFSHRVKALLGANLLRNTNYLFLRTIRRQQTVRGVTNEGGYCPV